MANPDDISAYRAFSKILADYPDVVQTDKLLRGVLKRHPEIRRHRPKAKRQCIHLGDWVVYADAFRAQALDSEGVLADTAEIERRIAEADKRRSTPRDK